MRHIQRKTRRNEGGNLNDFLFTRSQRGMSLAFDKELTGEPTMRYDTAPIVLVLVLVLVLDLYARERYQFGWFYRLRLFR